MARSYRHARRRTRQPKKAPGWVWMAAGLAIGLFIAFLVYLSEHVPESERGMAADVRSGSRAISKTKPKNSSQSESRAAAKTSAKPRFEFYTILPEREVRVPEHELRSRSRTTQERSASSRYVLQVGSFRRLEEADRLKASLALIGLEAEIQSVSMNGDDTWYRVRLGPYRDLRALDVARRRLREHEMEALVLKDRS